MSSSSSAGWKCFCGADEDSVRGPFFNREADVALVRERLSANLESGRPRVLVAPHMFGAGKSTFCQNLAHQLTKAETADEERRKKARLSTVLVLYKPVATNLWSDMISGKLEQIRNHDGGNVLCSCEKQFSFKDCRIIWCLDEVDREKAEHGFVNQQLGQLKQLERPNDLFILVGRSKSLAGFNHDSLADVSQLCLAPLRYCHVREWLAEAKLPECAGAAMLMSCGIPLIVKAFIGFVQKKKSENSDEWKGLSERPATWRIFNHTFKSFGRWINTQGDYRGRIPTKLSGSDYTYLRGVRMEPFSLKEDCQGLPKLPDTVQRSTSIREYISLQSAHSHVCNSKVLPVIVPLCFSETELPLDRSLESLIRRMGGRRAGAPFEHVMCSMLAKVASFDISTLIRVLFGDVEGAKAVDVKEYECCLASVSEDSVVDFVVMEITLMRTLMRLNEDQVKPQVIVVLFGDAIGALPDGCLLFVSPTVTRVAVFDFKFYTSEANPDDEETKKRLRRFGEKLSLRIRESKSIEGEVSYRLILWALFRDVVDQTTTEFVEETESSSADLPVSRDKKEKVRELKDVKLFGLSETLDLCPLMIAHLCARRCTIREFEQRLPSRLVDECQFCRERRQST